MLDINRMLNQDRLLRALAGLNRRAFDTLLEIFSSVFERTRHTYPWQRAVGGRRKARLLSIQKKLFFLLFYFKGYPTFDFTRIIFNMHRSQADERMHRLQPILGQTIGQKMVLPEHKLDSVEAFLARFPQVERVIF